MGNMNRVERHTEQQDAFIEENRRKWQNVVEVALHESNLVSTLFLRRGIIAFSISAPCKNKCMVWHARLTQA